MFLQVSLGSGSVQPLTSNVSIQIIWPYKNDTANLGQSKSLFHIMKNIENKFSFQTMVLGNLVLVLTNDNKTLIIDRVF